MTSKTFLGFLLLITAVLLGACSGGKGTGQPLAACFEYGPAVPKEQVKSPVFALYKDGTLVFRTREAAKVSYQTLKLDDAEMAEVLGQIEGALREPGLEEDYFQASEPVQGSIYVFFNEKSATTIYLHDMPAVEVASLRVKPLGPDFSQDSAFPNSLISYITTMGMIRVSAADPLPGVAGGRPPSLPGEQRWLTLFARGVEPRVEIQGGNKLLRLPNEKGDMPAKRIVAATKSVQAPKVELPTVSLPQVELPQAAPSSLKP